MKSGDAMSNNASDEILDIASPLFKLVYLPEFCQLREEDSYRDRQGDVLAIDRDTHYNFHRDTNHYKVFSLSRTADKMLLYHPVDDIEFPG